MKEKQQLDLACVPSQMADKLPKIFFEIHSGLPREGPGDNESTRKAYLMLCDLPENPRILDVGCGPGMQTIELAKLSNGTIEALDNYQPYLEQLMNKAKEENVAEKIRTINGNMFALNYADNSFDVIWSEGAIYIIGFEKGLREWKHLLTAKGYIAVSEVSWLKPNPPEELRAYWEKNYPAIRTIQENLEIVKKVGYRIISYFVLPEKNWWENYYKPIEAKLPSLRSKHADDHEALNFLAIEQLEIDMFRKYSEYYSYVFYIMQTTA